MIAHLPNDVLNKIVDIAYRTGQIGRKLKSITILTPKTASLDYMYIVEEKGFESATDNDFEPYVVIK